MTIPDGSHMFAASILLFVLGLLCGLLLGLSRKISSPIAEMVQRLAHRTPHFGLRRRLFFITGFSILFGVILILLPIVITFDSPELVEIIRDVGRAFIAAGIIGFIVELAEVKNFFAELLTELITGASFRKELSIEALDRHAELSVVESVQRKVINSNHEGSTFVRPIFRAILPGLTEVYRENYDEQIRFLLLSVEELTQKLTELWIGADATSIVRSEPTYLLETTTTFSLVAPNTSVVEFKGFVRVDSALIPGLEAKYHAKCTVAVDDGAGEPVVLEVHQREERVVVLTGSYVVPMKSPRVRVKVKTWEFNDLIRTNFTAAMAVLTKGLNVLFTSNEDVYPDASVFGLNVGPDYLPQGAERMASITRSELILLPDHGYVMSWSLPRGIGRRGVPEQVGDSERPE